MKYLLILLAAFPLLVHADYIVTQGDDSVWVSNRECTNKQIMQLAPIGAKLYEAGAVLNGHMFAACWTPVKDKALVHLYYADGDQGLIPVQAFHKMPEA